MTDSRKLKENGFSPITKDTPDYFKHSGLKDVLSSEELLNHYRKELSKSNNKNDILFFLNGILSLSEDKPNYFYLKNRLKTRIKGLIEINGYTMEDIARNCLVSKSVILLIRNGDNSVTDKIILLVAYFLESKQLDKWIKNE